MDPAQATTPTETSSPTPSPDSSGDWMSSLDAAFANLDKEETPADKAPAEETKAPTEETKAPAEETETKGMTASAGARFKELKGEVKEWRTKHAELEKQLQERASGTPQPDPAQAATIAELQARVEEYEKVVAVSHVESSAEYKNSVMTPLNKVLSLADALSTKYDVDSAAMNAALAESDVDKQSELLQDLAGGFNERDRMGLYRLADDVGAILKRREDIQANASAAGANIAQTEAAKLAQETAAQTQAREAARSDVWKLISSKVSLVSDPKIAKEVQDRVAQTDLATAKPDVQAYVAYSGAVLPHVLRENKAQASTIAELQKTIADFRRTVPKAGGGKAEPSKEAGIDMGFLDAIERNWG